MIVMTRGSRLRTSGRRAIAIGASLLLLLGGAARAEEHAAEAGEPEWKEAPNVLTGFAGTTREDGEDSFTVGAEYARRVNPIFGYGGFIDYAGGDRNSTFLAGAVYFYVVAGLIVQLGAGVENRHGHNKPAGRVAVIYEFEVGRTVIAPMAAVEFEGRKDSIVLGMNLGRRF